MVQRHVLAIDLGAESGRLIQIGFQGSVLRMDEVHRFPNLPVQVGETLYWDVLSLWREIQMGISKVPSLDSLGIDTWGVDFALLDRNGQLLGNPVHYRDSSSSGMMEWVFDRVPRMELYQRTGIQFMSLNGLYRLASLSKNKSPILKSASTFLTIADLFNYWLSGNKICEFTHTTTQQMYNQIESNWDYPTLEALGIPTKIFPEVYSPGAQIGKYNETPVILPACHDTASAVVAIPTRTKNYAYLSSGTWSLLGLELDHLIINKNACELNLTNEGGYGEKNRFLKNIAGLWLVQQSRSTWSKKGNTYSYEKMTHMANEAEAFQAFIDPDLPEFVPPGDMPERIRDFCKRSNQKIPETDGEVLRVIFESLALKYRYCLDLLTSVSGSEIEVLHIVGGGSRNDLLNQFCSNAIQCPVIAGPVEATALGNALVQLIELGEIKDLEEAREILFKAETLEHYEPISTVEWEEAYLQFQNIIGQ